MFFLQTKSAASEEGRDLSPPAQPGGYPKTLRYFLFVYRHATACEAKRFQKRRCAVFGSTSLKNDEVQRAWQAQNPAIISQFVLCSLPMRNHNGQSLSPAMQAARRMPIKDHFHHGRPFRIEASDAARWLVSQPEILQDVFNRMKSAGMIVYADGQ